MKYYVFMPKLTKELKPGIEFVCAVSSEEAIGAKKTLEEAIARARDLIGLYGQHLVCHIWEVHLTRKRYMRLEKFVREYSMTEAEYMEFKLEKSYE